MNRSLRAAALGAAAALFTVAPVASADVWTNATGNMSWMTGGNWADGTIPTNADPVIFPAPGPASPSVIIPTGVSVSSLTFDNSYQLTGGFLTAPQVSVATGKTATIGSVLNANEFAKNGAGVLSLTGSNSFTGYLNLNAGTLRVSSDSNLGTSINGVKLTGTLEAAGTFSTTKSIQVLGGAIKVAAGQTLTLPNSQLSDGTVPSYPALYKEGDGTLILGSHNSRQGGTFINGGTLRVESTAQPGYGAITVGAATLELHNKFMSIPSVMIGPASTLRGVGASTVGVSSAAGVDIFPTWSSEDSPGSGGLSGPSGPTAGAFNVTFTGSATAGSVINITGAGTVIPYAPNYQGAWNVNGGTMRAQTSLGTGNSPIDVGNGGTLLQFFTLNRSVNLNNSGKLRTSGSVVTAAPVNVAATANVTLATSLSSETMQIGSLNALTGGAGATINAAGPGVVHILSSTNTYSGGWNVTGGTLRVPGGVGGMGVGTSPIAINGGTYEMQSGSFSRSVALNSGTLRGTGATIGGTVTIAPAANVSLSGSFLLGDGANDLTGGDSSTYIHINGSGGMKVGLMHPSNVIGHWLIDGGGIDVPADSHLGAASNTITLNTFGALRTTASATFARNLNAQGGTLDSSTHTSSFENITGTGLTKQGSGTIEVNHLRIGHLNLNNGVLKIKPNGTAGGVSKLDSISLTGSVQLDLADNAMVMVNTNPGSWDGSAYTGMLGLVAAGFNGGTWNGTHAVMTSEADALLTTLAVMQASQASLPNPNEFRGMSIGGTDTIVAFTWGGDANLDGELDGDDYFAIDSNVAQSGSVFGYHKGDFDYDGDIDGDDYFIIDGNIAIAQASAPFPASSGLTAVPEPASALVFATAGLLALRRRRR